MLAALSGDDAADVLSLPWVMSESHACLLLIIVTKANTPWAAAGYFTQNQQ